jgi:hypothetical protein
MATMAPRRGWNPQSQSLAARARLSLSEVLEPTYREIFLSALVVIWFAFGIGLDGKQSDVISTVGLVAFTLVLAWGGYRQVRRDVSSLWTPLLWYRLAMMSYFGIGSLVPIWTNDQTREMMEGFYQFFAPEIVKLNLLIVIFHIVFLVTSKIIFVLMKDGAQVRRDVSVQGRFIHKSNFSMIAFGTLCLAVGTIVNYLIVLPQIVGWINLSLFSTLYNFAALAWLGYFMVTLWALDNNRPGIAFTVIAIAIGESMIGLIAMSKSVILLPAVMVGLAFIYHRQNIRRVVIFAGLLVTIFMTLSPMITFVRQRNLQFYNGQASPTETFEIYGAYFGNDRAFDNYAEVEVGWMRLSYVNAGTFAISQYDRGLPGNSYRYLPIVLIPRIIYPDKPFITDVSREFSYAANGNYDSSSSSGLAAEAYWNLGWTGVIVISMFVSMLFTLWSIYSFTVIDRAAWHLFFVVLLGMRTSIRVDGSFVADIIGASGVGVLAHVALELLNRFLPHRLVQLFGEKDLSQS